MMMEYGKEIYQQVGEIAYYKATQLRIPGFTVEDLIQEAHMNVLKALASYSSNKGGLKTWLNAIIHNRFISIMAQANASKRLPAALIMESDLENYDNLEKSDGKNQYENYSDDGEIPIDERLIAAEQSSVVSAAIEKLQCHLNAFDRQVAAIYMRTPPEIKVALRNMGRKRLSKNIVATYLGVSAHRVTLALQRMAKAARIYGLEP
jgi:RNA polymerase sigma factor (sigma-70 family)